MNQFYRREIGLLGDFLSCFQTNFAFTKSSDRYKFQGIKTGCDLRLFSLAAVKDRVWVWFHQGHLSWTRCTVSQFVVLVRIYHTQISQIGRALSAFPSIYTGIDANQNHVNSPPLPQLPSYPNPISSSVRQTQSQKMLVTVNGEREDCLTCKDGRSARRTTTYSSKRIPEGYTPFCQCVDVWGFAYCVIVNLRFKARIIADHNQNIPSLIGESSSRENRQGQNWPKKKSTQRQSTFADCVY